MNWMGKSRAFNAAATLPSAKPGPAPMPKAAANLRVSNGLKDFLWLLTGIERGRLLDLGPVWQATVDFFIQRGFRVTTEDLLRAWKEFLAGQEERLRQAPAGEDGEELSPAERAERFLESTLLYPPESFHAVLAWDLFDYMDAELLPRVGRRLHEMLRPGGAVLAIFHSRPAERFHRYRIVDHQTIEMCPVPPFGSHERIFQNREILNLFGRFRSSKTFIGRDQLREGLFIK